MEPALVQTRSAAQHDNFTVRLFVHIALPIPLALASFSATSDGLAAMLAAIAARIAHDSCVPHAGAVKM